MASRNEEKNRISEDPGSGRNFLTAILGNFFPPFVSIATAPILAQSLGVDGRGEVAAAIAPLTLVLAVATLGIPEATVNAVARNPKATATILKHGLTLLFLSAIISTIAVYIISSPLAGGDANIRKYILIALSALLPNLALALIRAAAMGRHQWKLVTASRIVEAISRFISIFLLALLDQLTVLTATLSLAFAPILGGIVFIKLATYASKHENKDKDIEPSWKKLFNYGLRIWIGGLSGVILTRIGQVLMVPLASSYELGLYVVAVSIAEIPLVVNSAVREVTFAAESTGSEDERVGLASRLSTVATGLIAIAIAVSMSLWIAPLFGKEFEAATLMTLILLAATVLGNPGSVAGASLSGRGRPELRSLSLLVAGTTNVILLLILVPRLGGLGATYATIFGNLIASNLNIYFLWKKFQVSPWLFYKFNIYKDFKSIYKPFKGKGK